jgi:ADP-heptose:LPS heptosyltransferase
LPLGTVWPLPARYLPVLDQEALASTRKKEEPPLARQVLTALNLPHYDRVINLDYGPFAGWLTQNIPATARQGGLLTRDGRRVYLGAWHSYLFAEIAARDANPFNLTDLWRGAAGALTPFPDTGFRPHVPVSATLPFALPEGRRIALNPGAAEAWRRWPAESFAELVLRLRARQWTPILVGAPADAELCAAIAARCQPPLENFAGRTSVPEMAALLQQTELLVSNDTGAVHIAAAAGTRVVGLYGDIPYFRMTAPWSAGNLVLHTPGGSHEHPAPPLPVDLVEAAVCERMGVCTATSLASALAAHGVEAWESHFLPPGSDPLGGLGWRPLHPLSTDSEQLLRAALRPTLAAQLCGHPLPAPPEASSAIDAGMQNDVQKWLRRLDDWNARAQRLRRQKPNDRRSALLLLSETEEITPPQRASLRLLLAHLARQTSFLVTLSPPEMLATFADLCRTTREVLRTAAALAANTGSAAAAAPSAAPVVK